MTRWTIKVIPMSGRVLKIINLCEKKLQCKEFENKLKFIDRRKENCDGLMKGFLKMRASLEI